MLALVGCSRSNDACTCLVENNRERRTLGCGETSCVAGSSFACVDEEMAVQRGACTETPDASTPTPTSDPGSVTPPDTSCDDLRTFCSTYCSKPATVATDCQSTANTGEPRTCASWQATNGVLCRP